MKLFLRGVKMKKYIIYIMILGIFACSLTTMGPVSAAQGVLIDHGTKYTTSDAKCMWKTYQINENTILVDKLHYYKEKNKWVLDFSDSATLEKISSSEIKITVSDAWGNSSYYENTKLSTLNYYNNVYRPEWLEN